MNEPANGSDQNAGGGFFSGFLVGAIAGAAVAYMITQEETRDLIAGKAREAANAAIDATGDLRANAADLYARGRTVVDNARSNVEAAVAEGQQTAANLRTDLSAKAESSTPTTDV